MNISVGNFNMVMKLPFLLINESLGIYTTSIFRIAYELNFFTLSGSCKRYR